MPVIDKDALKKKYAEERAKRIRADGNEQYIELKGQLAHYAEDPYTPKTPRDPITRHVKFAFIGGGFAGLVAGARLKEAGIDDVCIIEKGGDFGGTWYWNRYPGAQCDTASMVYMPLLEETGHMPSEKYAHGPEIYEHSQRIGKHYNLYDGALFHTQVTAVTWDDDEKHWKLITDQADALTAKYVGIGTGPLHVPKLPGIPGIETFQGHSFHTSRWDYDYTGGDHLGAPMTNLADKRVAIVGTGATSVQCVPHLAKACQELYVFQRTPSSVDVRNNGPIDADWFTSINKPGWQQEWLESFTANQTMGQSKEDLVMDGWTEISRRVRSKIGNLPPEKMNPEGMLAAFEDSDFEKMEEIRARVDDIVSDKETAENLKAYYRQLCKRPCFHDQYLQAYNEPGTFLVDTDGKGVETITETGITVAGEDYPVDCIIYASGFEVGTPQARRSGFEVTGRDGETLTEHWENGIRTKHGTHVHGFPNLFISMPTQGANLISNVPHNLTERGKTIAAIVKHAESNDASEVEVSKEAEDKWVDLLLTGAGMLIGTSECTPGYYNLEGQPSELAKYAVGHPGGAVAYFQYIDKWRNSGDFEGINFR